MRSLIATLALALTVTAASTAGVVATALAPLDTVAAVLSGAHGAPAEAAPRALPACEYEDGSSQRVCVWDARHMGNGIGRSVIVRNGGTDRVTYRIVSHRRAHALIAAWEASR